MLLLSDGKLKTNFDAEGIKGRKSLGIPNASENNFNLLLGESFSKCFSRAAKIITFRYDRNHDISPMIYIYIGNIKTFKEMNSIKLRANNTQMLTFIMLDVLCIKLLPIVNQFTGRTSVISMQLYISIGENVDSSY